MSKPLKTVEDLNFHNYPTDGMIDANLLVLYQRLKYVEALFVADGGFEFIVTSGLRSNAQQAKLIAEGKSLATKSRHLIGCAADIYDPDGRLKEWLLSKPEVLEVACLWCEAADYTSNWWHAQIIPPGSGRRWFVP